MAPKMVLGNKTGFTSETTPPHDVQVVAKKPIFMLLRAGGLMPERSTIHK